MKNRISAFTVLALGVASMAHAQAPTQTAAAPLAPAPAAAAPAAPTATPTKVAIIQLQNALLLTKEGQKASAEMNTKFGPRRAALQKQQDDLTAMQDQLNKGAATLSEEARQKIAADLANGEKDLKRKGEDFESDVQTEEGRLMNELLPKIHDVIIKYATQNGFAMVIDVSNQQTGVLWADQGINITDPVVKIYDLAHPVAAGAGTPAGSAAPSPPAAPPAKKP